MARNVAVVGAELGGLVLALGLLQRGHRVSLFAERSAEEVRTGPATGSSALMGRSVPIERDLGLNCWDDVAEPLDRLLVTLHTPAPAPLLEFSARLHTPGRAVDQRLKLATWLDRFATALVGGGEAGRLVVGPVGPADLDAIAAEHDLVVVASGRGALSALFKRDSERSLFEPPQRVLTQFYVTGLEPGAGTGHLHLVPGAGEFLTIPCYVAGGYRCHAILIEAEPGGPFDVFAPGEPAPAALAAMKGLVAEHLPAHYDIVAQAELAGANAVLRGVIVPEVRQPVGYTPSGRPVAGLGEAVVINDLIAGQGANSATRWAYDLLDHIDGATGPFDETWMRDVFAEIWEDARHLTNMSNALLAPAPPHQLAILAAAGQDERVAGDVVHAFEDPASLDPWFFEPYAGLGYLDQHVGAAKP